MIFSDLCPTLEAVPNVVDYCGRNNRWRTESMANKTSARDVETQIYLYARENLAIINIFIKVTIIDGIVNIDKKMDKKKESEREREKERGKERKREKKRERERERIKN